MLARLHGSGNLFVFRKSLKTFDRSFQKGEKLVNLNLQAVDSSMARMKVETYIEMAYKLHICLVVSQLLLQSRLHFSTGKVHLVQ